MYIVLYIYVNCKCSRSMSQINLIRIHCSNCHLYMHFINHIFVMNILFSSIKFNKRRPVNVRDFFSSFYCFVHSNVKFIILMCITICTLINKFYFIVFLYIIFWSYIDIVSRLKSNIRQNIINKKFRIQNRLLYILILIENP